MSEYITNLTDNLIRTEHFDAIEERMSPDDRFRQSVQITLVAGAVSTMKPETLGKIVCAIGHGNVAVSKADIMRSVMFPGDCDLFLRDLVAYFLAVVILDRLADEQVSSYPKFRR